jgi:PAS domain S-box-containing protein
LEYLFVNDALAEFVEKDKEEMIGKTDKDLLPPKLAEQCITSDKQALNTEKIMTFEETLGKKIFETKKFKVNLKGKGIGLGGIVRDITERKKAEKVLRRSKKKLKKLNRIKSEMLDRISHELKTPLSSIKGFTDLLNLQHSENLTEEMEYIIGEIKKGTKRLEDLIKEIIEASKLEAGSMHIEKDDVNMTDVVERAVESVRGLRKSRDQAIQLDINENLITKGDQRKLLEVLENLLSNAIKYSPQGSDIFIGAEKSDNKIIISVKDNGIGFTEEEKNDLFTKFGKIERYGNGLDVNIGGSGLGLYISKKIIELHDGEIWMDSEGRNEGSTFYFSLPIRK